MKETTKKKIKTTLFWSGMASALLLFAQNVAVLIGYEIPAETIAQIMAAVNSLLGLLALSGVLVDTKEVDSFQAMKVKVKK